MNLSGQNKIIVYAFEKGYTVDEHGTVFFNNKKRSLNLNKRGYYNFTLRIKQVDSKDIFRRVFVHKLQAYQIFGDKMFVSGMEVRHLDNDKKNNSLKNIAIGTHQENMLDIDEQTRLNKAISATAYVKKYDHEEIIKLYNEGNSYSKIMQKLNIKSKGTISFIIKKSIQSSIAQG